MFQLLCARRIMRRSYVSNISLVQMEGKVRTEGTSTLRSASDITAGVSRKLAGVELISHSDAEGRMLIGDLEMKGFNTKARFMTRQELSANL